MTAMLDAFLNTLERLEIVIDSETEALQHNRVADLTELNHKKSHGLLELRRTMRVLGEEERQSAQTDLHRLYHKVEKNLSVLEIHMKAVQEVSAIIAHAIQESDSDGTYSQLLMKREVG
jgi:flagellar biosynthesis/type III secretory pathway chaperone